MATSDMDSEKTWTDPGAKDGSPATPPSEKENEIEVGPKEGETTEDSVTSEYPQGLRLFFLVLAIVFSVFLMALDQTIVATAIPKITDEFRRLDEVSWYGSAFFMTFGGFQSSWGKGYKYFPLKSTFLLAMFIFEVGSLLCAVAPNSVALIVGRAIAGIGGAGLSSGAFTIVAFAAEPKKRPLFTGILGATYGISAVIGPLLGGVLTDKASWRWCFYINLPIGGFAAAVIFFFFTTPIAAKPKEATWKEKVLQMDPVGVLLVMAGIITFTLALQYGGQTKPWSSSVVIGLLVGSVLIFVVFGIWEYFQDERAMVVPRLMKKRTILAGSIFQFFFAGPYFILLYYLPIYFQSIGNTSAIESGVRNLPLVIAVSLAGLAGGVSVSTTGYATPSIVVCSAFATVGTGLIYSMDIGTESGKWIGYQIICGWFYAFPYMMSMNIAQANSEPQDMSPSSSTIFFFQNIGGSFCLSAAQSIFANTIIATLATSAPDVNVQTLLGTGATELRTVFTPEQLPGVLIAYMAGIKGSFAFAIAMIGCAFVASFFNTWKRLHGGASKEAPAMA